MTTFTYVDAAVLMDDGTEYKIAADQRDQRRAMMPPALGGAGITTGELDPLGFVRAVAWSCLTRTGEYTDTWQAFDAACRFVQPDTPTEVDPTTGPDS